MEEKKCQLLIDLFKRIEVFDKEKQVISFDHVWYDPNNLQECSSIIYTYFFEQNDAISPLLKKDLSRLMLISPDIIGENLGVLPLSFFIAQKIGCQVSVWKELADIKWGTSAILGDIQSSYDCILLQDVIHQGATALKVAHNLKGLNWNLVAYLGIILDNKNGPDNVNQTLSKIGGLFGSTPIFEYILTVNDLQ